MTYVPFSVSRFPWKCIPLHCALVFGVMRVTQRYWQTQHLRQKDKLSFAFMILAFSALRDYVEGPERWVGEDLQVLLLLWHHWWQHQPSAGHKLQVKLNNPTHPIFQHLLSLYLWWNVFQDGNPKGRTPESCTHPLHLFCVVLPRRHQFYSPRAAIPSCPPAKLSTGCGNNST